MHLPAVEEASPRQAVARDEAGEVDGGWIVPDVRGCCEVCLGFIPRPMGSDRKVLRRGVTSSNLCFRSELPTLFSYSIKVYIE